MSSSSDAGEGDERLTVAELSDGDYCLKSSVVDIDDGCVMFSDAPELSLPDDEWRRLVIRLPADKAGVIDEFLEACRRREEVDGDVAVVSEVTPSLVKRGWKHLSSSDVKLYRGVIVPRRRVEDDMRAIEETTGETLDDSVLCSMFTVARDLREDDPDSAKMLASYAEKQLPKDVRRAHRSGVELKRLSELIAEVGEGADFE